MRRLLIASTLSVAALIAFAPAGAQAQQLPQPPRGFQPPPPPPIKPYNPVAVTPPPIMNDPGFVDFRKNLATIVQHKDRAALAKLVVAHGFFWVQDQDIADKSKPGIDNLAKAIDLDSANGAGWDILATDAADPTAMELPQHKGVFCAPAPPAFDPKAIEALLQQTQSDPTEWGYPLENGAEVRAAAQPNAPVVDKLGMYLVHVLPDSGSGDAAAASFLHIALPSGKTGYVASDAIAPLVFDQICYLKDASGWKITGYVGGVQP